MDRSANSRFIFTGGPGTGKTTVLNAFQARGFYCVADVARAIIRDRLDAGLTPRPEPNEFANSIFDKDVANYQASSASEIYFFDRGIVDSLGMLHGCGSISDDEIDLNLARYPYNSTVFLFPPWKEIYRTDDERDQSWAESVRVYDLVKSWYLRCGYQIQEVPIGTLAERVAFVQSANAMISTQ